MIVCDASVDPIGSTDGADRLTYNGRDWRRRGIFRSYVEEAIIEANGVRTLLLTVSKDYLTGLTRSTLCPAGQVVLE